MKIHITIEVEDEELVDSEDPTGLTEDGYTELTAALSMFGSIEDIYGTNT
jgi:hypothetical protein